MPLKSSVAPCLAALVVLASAHPAWSCDGPTSRRTSSVEAVRAYFHKQGKQVVTFLGYSGAGYEDQAGMLARAAMILDGLEPNATIVNIGASAEGIGAVYDVARQKGFATTGIISTQALTAKSVLSPCVQTVFFVRDELWGGRVAGTDRLSPTSMAMVGVSDLLVAIGGGDVSRDELQAGQRLGKKSQVFPADMNHALARQRAVQKGLPPPTDFRGSIGVPEGNPRPGRSLEP